MTIASAMGSFRESIALRSTVDQSVACSVNASSTVPQKQTTTPTQCTRVSGSLR